MRRTVVSRMTSTLAVFALLVLAARAAPAAIGDPPADEETHVRFVVVLPEAGDAAPARVYCSFARDGWPAGGKPLPRVAPGVYAGKIDVPAGPTLQYKFLREEDWRTVEKGPFGEEIPNRTLKVAPTPRDTVVVHVVPAWADRSAELGAAVICPELEQRRRARPKSTRTGDLRDHKDFESPELDNFRDLIVYVPPGYDESPEQRYPVLYMHDGQNCFDAATSFTGVEWGVDETAQKLITAGAIRPCIIVGVENTSARVDEYTPFPDPLRGGGDGDAYLTFLTKTVKPFIDRTYRTRPEREHTFVAGSSLGGLISLYAACEYEEVFSGYGVLAPSIWWGKFGMCKLVEQARFPAGTKLWIEVGRDDVKHEGEEELEAPSEYVRGCHAIVRLLEQKSFVRGESLHYAEHAGQFHHESDWASRMEALLEFFFGQKE